MKLNKISRSLTSLMRQNFSKRLQVFEGDRNSVSGIRATIFGATGFMGNPFMKGLMQAQFWDK